MKLEYGDFYKLAVSTGLTLISLAVLAPWLFLRETFDLLINREQLALLTPMAQTIIQDRQEMANTIIAIIPWFSVITAFLGLVICIVGAYFWVNKTQKVVDELNQLNKRLLEKQLESLSPGEVEAKRVEEVRTELTEEPNELNAAVKSASRVEEKIIALLNGCMKSRYEILDNRRIKSVFFDIVLLAKSQPSLDFIIEIRYIKKGFKYGWLRDNILKMVYSSLIYHNEMNREARPILIVVAPEKVLSNITKEEYYQQIDKEVTRLQARAHAVFYSEEKINQLRCDELNQIFDYSLSN